MREDRPLDMTMRIENIQSNPTSAYVPMGTVLIDNKLYLCAFLKPVALFGLPCPTDRPSSAFGPCMNMGDPMAKGTPMALPTPGFTSASPTTWCGLPR